MLNRLIVATLAVAMLAACAGGPFGAAPGSSTVASPGLLPDARATRGNRVRASIVIHVPRRKGRHGHYISPSTIAASVALSPAAGCSACSPAVTLNEHLTPSSTGCAVDATTGGTVCTIAFALKPGSYTGGLATYDGWNASTNVPSGNVLSQNQSFPISVSAGKVNLPTITLAGVAHSVTVIPLSSNLIDIGNLGGAYDRLEVEPGGTANMLAYALDADGNAIFGPGAPAFKVTVGGGFTSSVAGNNIRLIAPVGITSGAWTLTVSTAACASSSTCSMNWSIAASPLVAMANTSQNEVVAYQALLDFKAYATITAAAGLSSPKAIAFDSQGNLYIANATGGASNHGSVAVFAPPYNESSPTRVITSGITSPSGLVISQSSDRLAVLNGGTGSIAVFARGSSAPLSTAYNTSGIPGGADFDTADNLWYCATGSGAVKELTAASSYASLGSTISVGGSPVALAFDNLNDAFVGDSGSGVVTQYMAPAYTITNVAVSGISGTPVLAALKSAPGGRWSSGSSVIAVSGSNLQAELSVDSGSFYVEFNVGDSAVEIPAVDQDGNMWVADVSAGDAYGYFASTTITRPDFPTVIPASAIAAFPRP